MTTKPSFLIITDEEQGPVDDVCAILRKRGHDAPVIRPSCLASKSLQVSIIVDADGIKSAVVSNDENPSNCSFLTSDTRVWCRKPQYPGSFRAELDVDPEVSRFIKYQYRAALDSLYASPACWMNDLFVERKLDQNKPLQAHIASSAGLTIIPTLCTDDPLEFTKFINGLGQVSDIAIKAPAAWMSELEGSTVTLGTYTRRFSNKEALNLSESVRRAPVLAQPYIEKLHELRVTVVSDRIFACRIDSQHNARTRVDWRHYDIENTPHEPVTLEREVDKGIRRFMRTSGLRFACIDLIVTPKNETYFVEANPCGAFGWIEAITEMPIIDAIADWLIGDAPADCVSGE